MVFGRRGRGGPQMAEVTRMLDVERAKTAADRALLAGHNEHLARAEAALELAFTTLAA
jgi:argininosuccinate lyase